MHGASVWLLSVLGVWSTAGANFIHGREICELVGEFVDSRIYLSVPRSCRGISAPRAVHKNGPTPRAAKG